MANTLQNLLIRAKEVRDEKQYGANKATRVGSLFYDIILFFSELFAGKQNKLVAGEGVKLTDNSNGTATISITEQNGQIQLPIHALNNSLNVTEKLTITGILLNRNCKVIVLLDKLDSSNMLVVETQQLSDGAEAVCTPISLEQFHNKTVFVLVGEKVARKGIDISFELARVD